MSSAALITFLRGLEYDGASRTRPADLSVVCNDRHLRRFFEYLMTHVSKGKNYVSDDELKRFNQLKADGRAISNAEERRGWIEKKHASAEQPKKVSDTNVDELTKEWSQKRLEAARARLQALRDLEERWIKVSQHQTEMDEERAEAQAQLLSKQRADLKQSQIQVIGVDMKFRTASERLAKILGRIKSFSLDQSVVSSLFLIPTAADQCILSVQQALARLQSSHQSLKESKSVVLASHGSSNDGRLIEQEIHYLRDGFFMASLERFLEEVKLAEANARLERLHELKRCVSVKIDEDFLRSGIQDSLSTAQALKEKVDAYVHDVLIRAADMEAGMQVASVLRDEYCQMTVQAESLIAHEKEILTSLKHQVERIGALQLLLSEERSHLDRHGLQPIARVQSLLRHRTGWAEQCKDRLETITADKRRNHTTTLESRSQSAASILTEELAIEDSDARHSQTISDFIARYRQTLALHRDITKGAPELCEQMETYAQRLENGEKALLTSMKNYEAKKC